MSGLEANRRIVISRDDGKCVFCARPAVDVQHRVARGMGGTERLFINSPVNLICLCRPCHDRCEKRDHLMHQLGLWLHSWEDAAHTPVMRWDGTICWLLPDGTYSLEPPPGE